MGNKKLRVLQIVPDLNSGGVERGTVDLAIYLKNSSHIPIVISNGGAMVDELLAHDIKHVKMPVHTKNIFKMIANIFRLKRFITNNNIDVVHARSRAPAWSAYLATKLAGRVFITTFHAAYSATHPLKRFYNSVMLKGNKVIAISNFIAKHMVTRYHFPQDDITVIARGVDTDHFNLANVDQKKLEAMRAKYLPKGMKDKRVILLPARFTRIKGHMLLIKALSYIKKKDFVCVIVGKASPNNYDYLLDLEKLIDSNELGTCVKLFTDSEQDMLHLYAMSDIVICPSLEPEGFGRVVVEAQALGKIIISTAIGAPLELIEHGVTGSLAPVNDPVTFAEVIENSLKLSPTEVEKMAKASLKNVMDHYTLNKMCSKTVALYREALKEQQQEADE